MKVMEIEMEEFKISPFHILVLTSMFDGFWSSYSGVWFMTQWLPKLDPATISGREMVGSALAIICGMGLSKYRKGEVTLKEIVWMTILADTSIFLVFYSINLTAFVAMLLGQIYMVYGNAFWSKLICSNIDQDQRVEFDTVSRTVTYIGKCIGAAGAWFLPLTIPIEIAYISMVLAMDIDFLIRLSLIKFKVFKY